MNPEKLQPKDMDTILLAEKKGNDADLLLLDKIHELGDTIDKEISQVSAKVDSVKDSIPQLADVFDKIELIQGKKGEKGDTGDRGEKGDSIKGDKGDPGINGKDGQDGTDGVDGKDGKDGASGTPADEAKILAQLTALKDELQQRLDEFDTKLKAIPESTNRAIFGPGKTKLVLLDLSSQLNGSTKTFFVGTHFGIVSVNASGAPFGAFRPIVDYDGVGKNIVFSANVDAPSALATGQSLIITYLR